MGDVINLRRVRKQKARSADAVRADENRRLYGRSTAEKAAGDAARARLSKTLDGARRDDPQIATPKDDTAPIASN